MNFFRYFSTKFTITSLRHKRKRKEMRANLNEKLLSDLLEKIIFNENDLNEFKTAIINVSTGKIHPKLLKEKIISSRLRILEELLDLFPFYIKHINKKQSIKNFVETDQNPNVIKELREKNEFLTEIGSRLDIIYEKLQKDI